VVAKRSSNNILTPAAIASALAVILVTVVLSRGPAPTVPVKNYSQHPCWPVSVPIQYVVIPVSTSITTYPLSQWIPHWNNAYVQALVPTIVFPIAVRPNVTVNTGMCPNDSYVSHDIMFTFWFMVYIVIAFCVRFDPRGTLSEVYDGIVDFDRGYYEVSSPCSPPSNGKTHH
jgi:hypothetical protein